MKVVTGDILVDITGRNVSEYLLFTSDRLRLHRLALHPGWISCARIAACTEFVAMMYFQG
jgi:hypothetical protein